MGLGSTNSSSAVLKYNATVEEVQKWLKQFPPNARISATGTPGDRNEGVQYSLHVSWFDPDNQSTIGS